MPLVVKRRGKNTAGSYRICCAGGIILLITVVRKPPVAPETHRNPSSVSPLAFISAVTDATKNTPAVTARWHTHWSLLNSWKLFRSFFLFFFLSNSPFPKAAMGLKTHQQPGEIFMRGKYAGEERAAAAQPEALFLRFWGLNLLPRSSLTLV